MNWLWRIERINGIVCARRDKRNKLIVEVTDEFKFKDLVTIWDKKTPGSVVLVNDETLDPDMDEHCALVKTR